MIRINCTIDNVIYKNDESGYAVIAATDNDLNTEFTAVFRNGILNPKRGITIEIDGEWKDTDKYGLQFVVERYAEAEPRGKAGVIAYLSCGIFKGIGEKFARKIVDALGENALSIIENEPERVTQIKGVGKKKAEALINGVKEHKEIQRIVEFFSVHGISITMIMKMYRVYGGEVINKVKENPYRLCYEVDGIGFKKADAMALKFGVDKYNPERIGACLDFVLTESGEDGHTFLYKNQLLDASWEMLDHEVEKTYISGIIDDHVTEGSLKTFTGEEVFSQNLYYAEKQIARKLKTLNSSSSYGALFNVSIEDLERQLGVKYNDRQREAITASLTKNVIVLTGGPGTGKTTALLGMITAMRLIGLSIACAAPTAMAAKRMSEVTGRPAKTIHRLLEYRPGEGFTRDESNPLMEDVVIIDEISMVNVLLMSSLLKAVRPSAKLILVGDENQLPAIGPGNILHDVIESGTIHVTTLTEIFRQAEGSYIIRNAHNMINNKPLVFDNSKKDNDFFFIEQRDPLMVEETIGKLVTDRLPKAYGIKPTDIQVISPRRRNVSCCANELSRILQEKLNKNTLEIQYGNTTFRLGDKVMQIKNNYDKEIFNGDMGYIVDLDPDEKIMVVDYYGNKVVYEIADMDEVILAYASTVHKSQGSEYPIVVIPLLRSFSIMLKRNLIYTAITRAKNICIIVGDKRALQQAVADTSYSKRNTMLKEWLLSEDLF